MPYRPLGRTGVEVSLIGLGGWHLGFESIAEELSIRLIRTAVDSGINFMDNCWDYNDGASEKRMGKALRDGYRERAFLMTKIDGRTKREATKQLDESLRRLQTDHVDLVQHHEILRFEDPHRIFDEEGANAALVAAQQAGKTLSSVSLDTRIREFTVTCLKSRMSMTFVLTRYKCRLT